MPIFPVIFLRNYSTRAYWEEKHKKIVYFAGFLPSQSLFRALVLEHHEVDGLHGGPFTLHHNLNLDPGLAKLSF